MTSFAKNSERGFLYIIGREKEYQTFFEKRLQKNKIQVIFINVVPNERQKQINKVVDNKVTTCYIVISRNKQVVQHEP